MVTDRIVCTEQEPVHLPTTHAHIVAVGTGSDPNKADRRWTLREVLEAIDRGDRFYTESPTGRQAQVRAVDCSVCGHRIIRSAPDAIPENNLDNLRRCNF